MTRLNISVPDDLADRARAAGLNVSGVATAALSAELERRAKVAELDRYLAELEREQGAVPEAERRAAREWADGLPNSPRRVQAS